MKRFVALGFSCLMAATSCNLLTDLDSQADKEALGTIQLCFKAPVKSTTKAAAFDTNNYYLSIVNVSGEDIYKGPYGSKPDVIRVKSGTYEIETFSDTSRAPAFDHPRYGDSKTVVVSNGESASVSLLCTQVNCGVKFSFMDKFLQKFSGGHLRISQAQGALDYSFSDDRYAFFEPGNTLFSVVTDTTAVLFNKILKAGTQFSINLDASSNESESSVSIAVDTSVFYITEDIIVGDSFSGEDGSCAEKAYSVSSAKDHIGETVWVWGYIAGGYNSSSAGSITFTPPFGSASSLVIASDSSTVDTSLCISVTLASGSDIRDEANLVDHPENLHRKIFIKGTLVDSYLGLVGLKPVKEFSW